MKPSHCTTPRTMNDGVFMLNADPIERPTPRGFRWPAWVIATILALLFLLIAGQAHATGKPVEPTPTPTPVATSQSDASAGAIAGAAAQAGASSVTGDSSASAGSYSADSTRVYALPAPVWATVPQAAGCIVTSARSGAVGWNFLSGASSEQRTDPACAGIILAKAAYDHCHFESEALITQRVYETLFPGAPALPIAPGVRNLTLAECEAIKNPRPLITTRTIEVPVAAVCPTPAPAPVVPVKRRVKPRPPVATCK